MHVNEPHCAVKDAVENEEIEETRYIHYLQMLEDYGSGIHRRNDHE
jgi:ribosome biogenesis GTPase